MSYNFRAKPHREYTFIIRTISDFLGKMGPPTMEALSHNIKTLIQLFTYLNTPYVNKACWNSNFRRTVYAKIIQLENDIEAKRNSSPLLSKSTLKNIAKLMKIFNTSRTLYAPPPPPPPPPVALPEPVEPLPEQTTTCS